MIYDMKHKGSGRRRLRPWLAGGVLVVGATTAVAAGASSGDGPYRAAAVVPPTASAANQPTDRTPAAGVETVRWNGRVRLGALRFGTPGKLVVSPKGKVPLAATHHWYKKGTKVTVRAVDTRTARFLQWTGVGGCKGKKRTCTITMNESKNVIASYGLDKKGAKGLKRSDRRLQILASD
jgi:hypothetical protein